MALCEANKLKSVGGCLPAKAVISVMSRGEYKENNASRGSIATLSSSSS